MQKFKVGSSQEIDSPDGGTLEASCHLEMELDISDKKVLGDRLRYAHDACQKAVKEELAILDS